MRKPKPVESTEHKGEIMCNDILYVNLKNRISERFNFLCFGFFLSIMKFLFSTQTVAADAYRSQKNKDNSNM